MLELRNPHSVLAALKVRPKAVRSIRLSSRNPAAPWDEVAEIAGRLGIPVSFGAADRKSQGRKRDTERTGAGSAKVEPPSPVPLSVVLKNSGDSRPHGLWLALDRIQDPQNLGAVFRLAGFFGIRGIVMTKDKTAPVNGTVCDVATGGVEYVPYCIAPNLAQALKQCQKQDIWILGTCERAYDSLHDIALDRNWMLVMGNEGDGLRRLTRETCDSLVSLPPLGPVPSLNVAAATAACLSVLTAGNRS